MATVQTFDVTANKFNVYRIPNAVISYSHKKCADKQNNFRSERRPLNRQAGFMSSVQNFTLFLSFLLALFIYFFFLSRFVSNVFLGLFSFSSFFIFIHSLLVPSFLSVFFPILIHVVI